jgi:hypothetical protein
MDVICGASVRVFPMFEASEEELVHLRKNRKFVEKEGKAMLDYSSWFR